MPRKRVNLPYDRAAEGARVSASRAAELLNCSRSWVYMLIAEGRLKGFRIGTRKGVQVTMASIRLFLNEQTMTKRIDNKNEGKVALTK